MSGHVPIRRDLMQGPPPGVPIRRDRPQGPPPGVADRRRFLKLMAASLALGGVAGCDDRGSDEAVPYVRQPDGLKPGELVRYASSTLLGGVANGVLVTTRDGRPLKIEGNPAHPFSRGGTDVFGQGSVLGLYDPDRSQSVLFEARAADWADFRRAATGWMGQAAVDGGAGLRLLTGPVSSLAVLDGIAALQRRYPAMRWHAHDAAGCEAARASAARVFGRRLDMRLDFAEAGVIVALDGDFLDPGPAQAGQARAWQAARAASAQQGRLLAMHAACTVPGLTSAKADHAVAAGPEELERLAQALLAAAGGAGGTMEGWLGRAAAALAAHRGEAIVCAGAWAPAAVQDAVHRINAAYGNLGRTVLPVEPVIAPAASLEALVAEMAAGRVTTLVMLDANPVQDAPGALDLPAALARVRTVVHAGSHVDETARHSTWHLPLAHPLESWGDARAADGTISLVQPTIAPLYGGRGPAEILALLNAPGSAPDGLALLRAAIAPHLAPGQDFAAAVQAGFVPGSAFAPVQVAAPVAAGERNPDEAGAGLFVQFRPDASLWDGSLADNAWLQELPRPLTGLVWDNAVTIAPALAAREGLANGDMVRVRAQGRFVEGPVLVLAGQADGVLGMSLGGGRGVADRVSSGAGFNPQGLRGADGAAWLAGASMTRLGHRRALAVAEGGMEGQDFVRVQRQGAAPVGETLSWNQPSFYPRRKMADPAWGMVIDLDSCIGCNACMVACQAENNVAVVGREQVAMGRQMHWLRIDRHAAEAGGTHFQPVPCMQCEDAPCELGCPVEATVHDASGLNEMVYNRCIGTRACAGYCPYKVRHFNWFDYAGGVAPSVALQRNPEVSVRGRGVMEKCTYCVQRIEAARIEADVAGGPIADGAVQTACQGACPTRAISFGNLADDASEVARQRADGRNYALLGELNTRPRTSYLAARAPEDDA